jgi:hypothetical protein
MEATGYMAQSLVFFTFLAVLEEVMMNLNDRARSLMIRHHQFVKNRQQTLLDRTAAEAGIPMDAESHWSHIQGKPSHDLSMSYDRSSASMS